MTVEVITPTSVEVDVTISPDIVELIASAEVEVLSPESPMVVEVITAGPQGPTGPAGGGGGGGTAAYVHTQDSAATSWTVHHNLGYYPNVTVVDTSKNEIEGDKLYIDMNTVQLNFDALIGGQAYCS